MERGKHKTKLEKEQPKAGQASLEEKFSYFVSPYYKTTCIHCRRFLKITIKENKNTNHLSYHPTYTISFYLFYCTFFVLGFDLRGGVFFHIIHQKHFPSQTAFTGCTVLCCLVPRSVRWALSSRSHTERSLSAVNGPGPHVRPQASHCLAPIPPKEPVPPTRLECLGVASAWRVQFLFPVSGAQQGWPAPPPWEDARPLSLLPQTWPSPGV